MTTDFSQASLDSVRDLDRSVRDEPGPPRSRWRATQSSAEPGVARTPARARIDSQTVSACEPAIRPGLHTRLLATAALGSFWASVAFFLTYRINGWLRDPPEVELLRTFIQVGQAELTLALGVAGPLCMGSIALLWGRNARRTAISAAACLTGAVLIFCYTATYAIVAGFTGQRVYLIAALWCLAGSLIIVVWLAVRRWARSLRTESTC